MAISRLYAHVMAIVIRSEGAGDEARISQVTREAFSSHQHSSHTEEYIIDALRRAGALTLSLVAERGGEVVGHVAFSPVAISDGSAGWFGLGPVSVLPPLQNQGIGKALIEAGLAALRERKAAGCVLVGEPAYYTRFGFAHDPELRYPGLPPEYFLALRLGSRKARGDVTYHDAFNAQAPA
jgi:putative acetyltransferase